MLGQGPAGQQTEFQIGPSFQKAGFFFPSGPSIEISFSSIH
jgi:hypothetical protein